ncbi:toxin-antitoxin system YwqK family antitoxin [uncultured Acetobacteroides sp.]|uniref:toxin-antitoxin system YwqK family antitoxin n=1 Tax=uncultured Acetobacteroides sp. TaxID=1760811 RepID=UPI0029F55559|nr:toxin-antitoxin system YwqK family antitoxin [uncultured Acetobacteroides sp.]
MKAILFLVSCFLCCAMTVSAQQDTVFNQKNARGQKMGWWKKTYEDSTIQYVAYFENDKPVGLVKRYSKRGKIKSILNYLPNSSVVEAQLFNADGILLAKGKYEKNKKEGQWITYYPDGQTMYVENYKNNLKDGKANGYYPNKAVMYKYQYTNGRRVGAAVQYYSNGTLMEELTYSQDGKLIGPYRGYYDNNAKRIVGTYVNGEKDGEWITYSQDGAVFSKVTYHNGYPTITDEMVKKETEMLNSFNKMKGKLKEPTEEDLLR